MTKRIMTTVFGAISVLLIAYFIYALKFSTLIRENMATPADGAVFYYGRAAVIQVVSILLTFTFFIATYKYFKQGKPGTATLFLEILIAGSLGYFLTLYCVSKLMRLLEYFIFGNR
jgi:hypothetical protein